MSALRLAVGCLVVVMIAACVTIPAPASADVGVSFDFFYSNLSPHGHWMVSGSYGRVWQPAVYRAGWNPYYDGHWIYTDVGWAWVSDYEWGALPYHYGTWVVDDDLGWCWVPGYVWAPSWVVFRTGPDYIGWAPVPVRYSVGMSLGSISYRPDFFVFVANRDFLAPRVRGYTVPASRSRVIINNTRIENTIRIENNIVVNSGPNVNVVQRASGRRIETESIERVPRVGAARRMSRANLRVDAAGKGTNLRAAEPISKEQSESMIERDRNGSRGIRDRDSGPRRNAPEGDEVSQGRRNPRFSPSADPQAQPEADNRRETRDRERSQDQERRRGRRAPEPEASPQERGHRYSPSADPQVQQRDAGSGQERVDREREQERSQRKQQARGVRQRPRQQARDRNAVSPDDAQGKADARAKAKEEKRKKRAKPAPSEDNPSR